MRHARQKNVCEGGLLHPPFRFRSAHLYIKLFNKSIYPFLMMRVDKSEAAAVELFRCFAIS